MNKIKHIEKLENMFSKYDLMLNEHMSIFPKSEEVQEEEKIYENILDTILHELMKFIRKKDFQTEIEVEVFKVTAFVLYLSELSLPPSTKLRTKLLEIISLCYEINSKLK